MRSELVMSASRRTSVVVSALRRTSFMGVLAVAAMLVLPATALAQYGHPFHGTYSGGWGKDQANRLLFNTTWDGDKVTGTINSGGITLNVTGADIDYTNPEAWKVTLKAEGKDATGKPMTATAVGTLENIGVPYKIFRGTWTQGTQKGDFVVTRN
jgi:hypothetical protein